MNFNQLQQFIIFWLEDCQKTHWDAPEDRARKASKSLRDAASRIDLCDQEKVKSAIGDALIELIAHADYHGITLTDCLADRYSNIVEKTGGMVRGTFVSD